MLSEKKTKPIHVDPEETFAPESTPAFSPDTSAAQQTKFIPWPSDRDIRFDIFYLLEDTLGRKIEPNLHIQGRYRSKNFDSDWFYLKTRDGTGDTDFDYFVIGACRDSRSACDTVEVRMSRMREIDAMLEFTWSFRFRLENGLKFSEWQELAPSIKIYDAEKGTGIPFRPKVKLLPP